MKDEDGGPGFNESANPVDLSSEITRVDNNESGVAVRREEEWEETAGGREGGVLRQRGG
jgi:hypothetical protein